MKLVALKQRVNVEPSETNCTRGSIFNQVYDKWEQDGQGCYGDSEKYQDMHATLDEIMQGQKRTSSVVENLERNDCFGCLSPIQHVSLCM